MAIKKITDHQTKAKDRLPGFMQGATNMSAFLDSIASEAQNLETEFFNLLDQRHLTAAIGKQLDGIGQILDLARIIGETDSEYRSKLIARSGELSKGGEIESLLSAFVNQTGLSSPDELALVESFPAAVVMTWLTDAVDALDPIADAELISTMNAVRAGGVRLDIIRSGLTNVFEFSDESEIVGGNGPIDSEKGFGDEVLTGGGGLSRLFVSIPVIILLIYGYTSGGFINATTRSNVIDKYLFATETPATNVGDLTAATGEIAGQSSSDNGYASGGFDSTTGGVDKIEKFSFASDGNATSVVNLTVVRYLLSGQSSNFRGYASAGYFSGGGVDVIDKFSFASDVGATDVGNLTVGREKTAGQSSSISGYNSGGTPTGERIEKFSFSTDGNATTVGNLTAVLNSTSGQSSSENGYTGGGVIIIATNIINKFSFDTDGNATYIGDLTSNILASCGQSSSTDGYNSGGLTTVNTTTIQRFSFDTDGNSVNVSDLTQARQFPAGHQY